MPVDAGAATDAAVLEIDRFEWGESGRLELVGVWSGLRGRRFIRPTLVLEGGEDPVRRLLAVLDHKPWTAQDGEEWIAAFAWDGPPVKFASADLNVAPGLDLKLPPPRMRPGKPRRFKHRAVARDASRDPDDAPTASGPGIVSEQPKTQKAAAKTAPKQSGAAKTAPKETDATEALDAGAVARHSEELERAEAATVRMRAERDQALEELRKVRRLLEEARQTHERALADARADERATANVALTQNAELRAGLERQRELAYEARDEAIAGRDAAHTAREKACAERDDALAARKEAERERRAAFAERDRALKQADQDRRLRDQAIAERDAAQEARDAANKERDTIVGIHDRGLPVVPPKPRYLPDEPPPPSDFDVWGPRGAAIAALAVFAFILLRLFAG